MITREQLQRRLSELAQMERAEELKLAQIRGAFAEIGRLLQEMDNKDREIIARSVPTQTNAEKN